MRISKIKDVLGNDYLAIKFNELDIADFLKSLISKVGDKFEILNANQQKRDNNEYHSTILNVMEYNYVVKSIGLDNLINSIPHDIDDVDMLGIGKASRGSNVTYFIILKSEILNNFRESINLPKKDLHITIGFDKKDVFGVSKDISSII